MKQTLETLPEAERKAIEWHGRGYNYHWIAQDIGVSYETLKGWFKRRGKLYPIFQEYIRARNAKIQQFTNIRLDETKDNIVKLDSRFMIAYNSLLATGLASFRMRDFIAAAKLKGILLGQPMVVKVYGPTNRPLTDTEAQQEIKKLNKIITSMMFAYGRTEQKKLDAELDQKYGWNSAEVLRTEGNKPSQDGNDI